MAWEQLGWERTVGRYARLLAQAERRDATAAILAEVRQLEDRLGLSPMAMLRLRWEIESKPEQAATEGPADELEEARRRLRPSG